MRGLFFFDSSFLVLRSNVISHLGQSVKACSTVSNKFGYSREFINELFPSEQLWPKDLYTRAQARIFASEMHATGGAFPGAPRHIIYSLDTNVRRRAKRTRPNGDLSESIDYLTDRWQNLIHLADATFYYIQDLLHKQRPTSSWRNLDLH